MPARTSFGRLALAAIGAAALTFASDSALAVTEVRAQIPPNQDVANEGEQAQRYFVEFRSRRGAFSGHTFLVYGRLNARGQPLELHYAGNHPAEIDGLVTGIVLPVRTVIGPVAQDFTEPATNIYRHRLSQQQFAQLKRAVQQIRSTERHWHLVFYNCNDFVVEVAGRIGLQTPPSALLPHALIDAFRALNER